MSGASGLEPWFSCFVFVFVFATLLLNLLTKLFKEKLNADFWDSTPGTSNSLRLWAQRMGTEPALQRIQWRAEVSGLRKGGREYCGGSSRLQGTFSVIPSQQQSQGQRRGVRTLRREERAKESFWYSSWGGPGKPSGCCRSCLPPWEHCDLEKNLVCHRWFSKLQRDLEHCQGLALGDRQLSSPPKRPQTRGTSPMPPSHSNPTQGHTAVKTQSVATAELGLDAFSVKEQPSVRQEGCLAGEVWGRRRPTQQPARVTLAWNSQPALTNPSMAGGGGISLCKVWGWTSGLLLEPSAPLIFARNQVLFCQSMRSNLLNKAIP